MHGLLVSCLLLAACGGSGVDTSPSNEAPPVLGVFPLHVEPGKRYLVDASGRPFHMIGESPQALIGNLSEADAELFFANRKSHGFNTVWINLLCAGGTGCNADGTTFDGIAPFVPRDLSTPNEAYFARADRMIALAEKYSLLVVLNPAETISWLSFLLNQGQDKAYAYGKYLGMRYQDFPNILWMSGNDFQSWRTDRGAVEVVQRLAQGIRDFDSNHVHTVLLDYRVSSSLDDLTWQPIISLNAVYTYYPTYAKVLDAYSNQSASMPVFLAEANYEFENNTGMDPPRPEILRRQQYWSLLSGASGFLYGNGYTWGFNSNWKSALDTPGTEQIEHLKALFEPRAWFDLVPDTTHAVVTGGRGTFASTGSVGANDYVTAAGTPDGKLVMAYVPSARTITVDMSQFVGFVNARWYDPAAGTFSSSTTGSLIPNMGSHDFTTPGANADGDGDWVLVLEAQH